MLRALLLLLLCIGGGAVAFAWIRARLGHGPRGASRRLGPAELREMARQARGTPTLERALELRTRIIDALSGRSDRAGLRDRVDAAIRRVADQERLRIRILDALRGGEDLAAVSEDIEAFEERQLMLGRLSEQARLLEQDGERSVLELSNLHLALLDLSATEAVRNRGALGEALGELESAGESARRQSEAEAEVRRLLASSHLE